MKVKIKKLHPDAVIPSYAKEGDACMDLTAISKVFSGEPYDFSYETTKNPAYSYVEYGTGLAVEIPEGFFGLVRPRSSISKTTLIFATSGIIDSGYRGEITVRFKIEDMRSGYIPPVGERVAQLVILPYPHVDFVEVDELSESERGEGGYGSTGK